MALTAAPARAIDYRVDSAIRRPTRRAARGGRRGFAACGGGAAGNLCRTVGRGHRPRGARPRDPGVERRRLHLHAARRHDDRRPASSRPVLAPPTRASTDGCCTGWRAGCGRPSCSPTGRRRRWSSRRRPGRRRAVRARRCTRGRASRPGASPARPPTSSRCSTSWCCSATSAADRWRCAAGSAFADGAWHRGAVCGHARRGRWRPRRVRGVPRRRRPQRVAAVAPVGSVDAAAAAAFGGDLCIDTHAAPRRLPDGRVPRPPTAPSPGGTRRRR